MVSVIISIISVIIAVASIIVAILSWQKSRSIYGLERMKFAVSPGNERNTHEKEHDKKLMAKLASGKYTIITHYERPKTGYNIFVLGKIKK